MLHVITVRIFQCLLLIVAVHSFNLPGAGTIHGSSSLSFKVPVHHQHYHTSARHRNDGNLWLHHFHRTSYFPHRSAHSTLQQSPIISIGLSNDDMDRNGTQFDNKSRHLISTPYALPFGMAIVGMISTWIGLKLFFYPLQWTGIPIFKIVGEPFGLIGWQGIVPTKRYKFAKQIIDISLDKVMPIQELFHKLDPQQVSLLLTYSVILGILRPVLNILQSSPEVAAAVLRQRQRCQLRHGSPTTAVGPSVPIPISLFSLLFTNPLTRRLISQMEELLQVKDMLLQRMCENPNTLVKMLQAVSQHQLKQVVLSSMGIGFALGVLYILFLKVAQTLALSLNVMNILTCWPLIGFILGSLTNWLALKWLFAPLYPIKLGPVKVHGHFLAKQKEVSRILSSYFSDEIMPTKEVWRHLLQDPCLSRVVNMMTFSKPLSSCANTFDVIHNKIMYPIRSSGGFMMTRLFHELFTTANAGSHPILTYTEKALQLKDTLATKLSQLPPAEFKEVIHTVFKDDEIALVMLGGVMGLSLGFVKWWIDRKNCPSSDDARMKHSTN